jgi:glutamate/tyrosine decarboxylase-like PLP-dependent enzyme
MRPLHLPPGQFRAAADRITELADRWLEELNDRPIMPHVSADLTERSFDVELPEQGLGELAFVALEQVLAQSRAQNGRFWGYILGSGEPIAAATDFLANVINQNVTSWRSAPAAVMLERSLIRRLGAALGMIGFSGSLCGGGSMATLMGLAMAREQKTSANEHGASGGIVYASTEAHMSVSKALSLLGLGRANLRSIAVDTEFRIRIDALELAIQADHEAGKKPIAIVGNAGAVATGAIDPLDALADLAQKYGLWLHVDGAYGGFAALAVPEQLGGLERADSIALDAHKWLYQPLDCGVFLYRDEQVAMKTFSDSHDYARPLGTGHPIEGFAFFEESIELSRHFRALKLWTSLRYHGLGAFRQSIQRDLDHAQRLALAIARAPQLELLAPVPLSAVCFRHKSVDADAFNKRLLQRLNERGNIYLSNASIRGQFALRACFTNHRTTDGDVDRVVPELLEAAKSLS